MSYQVQRFEGDEVGWETVPETTRATRPMSFASEDEAVERCRHIVSLSSSIYRFRVLCPGGRSVTFHKDDHGQVTTAAA